MLSSEELAATLSQIMREEGELTLIIGSSHGLSPRVKERADLRLSFSRLTFPHQMMRVLTLEAVYRALTILAGRKYHKEGPPVNSHEEAPIFVGASSFFTPSGAFFYFIPDRK